ncbi:MAG: trehalose-phosphatase [bacterium]
MKRNGVPAGRDELDPRLEALAQVPILLVGSDYDGTLAPLVDDPAEARPHPHALVALRSLAHLPQTHVAVISGRALRSLGELSSLPEDVHLVGSHGSEFDLDFAERLPAEKARLLGEIASLLREESAKSPAFRLEEKPGGIAFHYRNVPAEAADAALARIRERLGSFEGVHVRGGKQVFEVSVVETDKGKALETIRRRVGASAAIFFGDDLTDEEAFASLAGPDVGVKIGEGETRAGFRLQDPEEAAQVLARLCELRTAWLERTQFVPIERHSMLSDQRTAALVAPGGCVVWLCAPRIDSPALFAELLGGPVAGHFTVRPAGGAADGAQSYRESSLVLETRWDGLTLTDALDCSADRIVQRAGRTDLIRVVEGQGEVEIEFAPRLDFGRIQTSLALRDGGLEVEESRDPIVLFSPGVPWRIEAEGSHATARATVRLGKDPLVLELRFGTGSLQGSASGSCARLDASDRFWKLWAGTLALPEVERSLVARSALVLKGLCYGPTGAIVAAATTSLPEHVGGVRNWDYRYCWLRDAAMAAAALVKLGSTSEALRYLDWVLGIVEHQAAPERLQPLYGVTGQAHLPEAEISTLSGYRSSRPVRIGNAASHQIQLDVFGPIVDLVLQLAEREAPLSSEHWRLVNAMVSAVAQRWEEPDHGIWEIRMPRRHHVHTKVMCWMTVDRACRVARLYEGRVRRDWEALRGWIAEEVVERGWSEKLRSFKVAYETEDVDASALEVGLSGLLPPGDPRFAATVDAVSKRLRMGPVVYRYRYDDGLPGAEGGFHLCTSWLIRAFARIGRPAEARELFDQMVRLAGPTGLYSEQWGAKTQRALGNFPQAYSHLGLIEAALALE